MNRKQIFGAVAALGISAAAALTNPTSRGFLANNVGCPVLQSMMSTENGRRFVGAGILVLGTFGLITLPPIQVKQFEPRTYDI